MSPRYLKGQCPFVAIKYVAIHQGISRQVVAGVATSFRQLDHSQGRHVMHLVASVLLCKECVDLVAELVISFPKVD